MNKMSNIKQVPEKFMELLSNNKAEIVAGVLRTTGSEGTSKVLGHFQQTVATEKILDSSQLNLESPIDALEFANDAELSSELLGGVAEIKNLSLGTLALSGTGIGIVLLSAVNIISKLNSISNKLDELGNQIEESTRKRRSDEFNDILAEIHADLDNISHLTTRNDPIRVAEQLQLSMSRNIRKLENIFKRTLQESIDSQQMWNLARLIRLCQEATMKTLFISDDLKTAEEFGMKESNRTIELLKNVSPRTLALEATKVSFSLDKEYEFYGISDFYSDIYSEYNIIYTGLIGSVYSLTNQMSIASILQDEDISGTEFIEIAENETENPVLFLPAN